MTAFGILVAWSAIVYGVMLEFIPISASAKLRRLQDYAFFSLIGGLVIATVGQFFGV